MYSSHVTYIAIMIESLLKYFSIGQPQGPWIPETRRKRSKSMRVPFITEYLTNSAYVGGYRLCMVTVAQGPWSIDQKFASPVFVESPREVLMCSVSRVLLIKLGRKYVQPR